MANNRLQNERTDQRARASRVKMRDLFVSHQFAQGQRETRLAQKGYGRCGNFLARTHLFQLLRERTVGAPFCFDGHCVRQEFQPLGQLLHQTSETGS